MALVLYDVGPLTLKWEVGLVMERISVTSKEIVRTGVRASSAGLPYNPTGATVEMAFLEDGGANPAGGDWKTAAWDTDAIGTYVAGCVVGPLATVTLAVGEYYAWIRIVDLSTGEGVVRQFGKLIVQ